MPTRVLTPVVGSDGVQKLKASLPLAKPPRGMSPPVMAGDVHLVRCLAQLRSKDKDLEKYIYLSQLKQNDENMFYYICLHHMTEITPLIYTPTVGDACVNYSHIYRRPEGIFVSYNDKGRIGSILKSWPRRDEARISVVTDGSRILGLGDLGINGMPISIGKLSLYVAGAGIRPQSTIPICLDLGTNTQRYLDDPLYMGMRKRRVGDAEMREFMEEFMHEMREAFPKLLIQFEDFSTDHAFEYLDTFRHRYPVFNDDIQGTGAVVLSGFVNAAKIASAAANKPLSYHRILFLGAGSAGVGVAMQLMSYFTLNGLTKQEARERIWLVDSQGIVFDERGKLAEHKKFFSRKDYSGPPITDLVEIIKYVKPTALLGLSTISGAFNENVVKTMAALNPRPIIFPLSNPVRLSECQFADAVEWSDGRVVFASGSPFPEYTYKGRMHYPGQGNNMYVFPGIGLGAILARASSVTDGMVEAASLALADSLTQEERDLEMIYPRIERIRDISACIAARVIVQAQKEGVDKSVMLRGKSEKDIVQFAKSSMWNPQV